MYPGNKGKKHQKYHGAVGRFIAREKRIDGYGRKKDRLCKGGDNGICIFHEHSGPDGFVVY